MTVNHQRSLPNLYTRVRTVACIRKLQSFTADQKSYIDDFVKRITFKRINWPLHLNFLKNAITYHLKTKLCP